MSSLSKKCLYEQLEVARDADPATIKRQYRKMALRYHPDKNQGDSEAEEKFKAVSFAYQVLSDADKRGLYDRHGIEAVKEAEQSEASGGAAFVDPNDLFRTFFGGGGGGIPGFGGGGIPGFGGGVFGGPRQRRAREAPEPTRTSCLLSLTTIVRGGKRVKVRFEINVMRTSMGDPWSDVVPPCPHCGGSGTVMQTRMIGPGMLQQSSGPCPACGGNGTDFPDDTTKVMEMRELSIELPKGGINVDRPLVLRKRGGYAYRAGEAPLRRDLYVEMQREKDEHTDWILRGTTLHWRPCRSALEGFVCDSLYCRHPDARVYRFKMCSRRGAAMVVPSLGVCGGALVIEVQWSWDNRSVRRQGWFKGLASQLNSQYVHLSGGSVVDQRCISADEYNSQQRSSKRSERASHHRAQDEEEGGAPECRQS